MISGAVAAPDLAFVAPAMNSFAARHILVGDTFLSPGELAWDQRGRITSLRRPRTLRHVRDVLLLPGLVDAHAHLQLPPLRERPPGDFVDWIGAVLLARGAMTEASLRERTRWSLRELLRSGCTAVGEIDSIGSSPAVLSAVGFAGRCYQEVTGFHLDRAASAALVRTRRQPGTPACPFGLSPHAPYSVSPPLFHEARRATRALSIHVAELPEEQQLLRTGRGPLRDLLASLGRLPHDYRPPGVAAVRYLERLQLLHPSTLLVHCQELEPGDAARIAANGSPIVVCPGTIRWFDRSPPPVEDWLRRGIGVALGTDSRASNRSMSMSDELALAAQMWPSLGPASLFAMATCHGGRALSRPGLGRLVRGGRADFFAVAADGRAPGSILEGFVHGQLVPECTWLRGRPTKRVVQFASRH